MLKGKGVGRMGIRRLMLQSMVLGVFLVCNLFIPPGLFPMLSLIWSVFLAWFSPLVGHKYCFGLIFFESQIMLARATFVPIIVDVAFAFPLFWWSSGTLLFMIGCSMSYVTAFLTIRRFNLRKRIGQFIS